MRRLLTRIANPAVTRLLRTPLHGLLGRSMILITVTGRRTGRPVTLPVQCARPGVDLLIRSSADRRWWRNLEGGGPVSVLIGGTPLDGHGEVLPADDAAPDRIAVRISGLRPRDATNRTSA